MFSTLVCCDEMNTLDEWNQWTNHNHRITQTLWITHRLHAEWVDSNYYIFYICFSHGFALIQIEYVYCIRYTYTHCVPRLWCGQVQQTLLVIRCLTNRFTFIYLYSICHWCEGMSKRNKRHKQNEKQNERRQNSCTNKKRQWTVVWFVRIFFWWMDHKWTTQRWQNV